MSSGVACDPSGWVVLLDDGRLVVGVLDCGVSSAGGVASSECDCSGEAEVDAALLSRSSNLLFSFLR